MPPGSLAQSLACTSCWPGVSVLGNARGTIIRGRVLAERGQKKGLRRCSKGSAAYRATGAEMTQDLRTWPG